MSKIVCFFANFPVFFFYGLFFIFKIKKSEVRKWHFKFKMVGKLGIFGIFITANCSVYRTYRKKKLSAKNVHSDLLEKNTTFWRVINSFYIYLISVCKIHFEFRVSLSYIKVFNFKAKKEIAQKSTEKLAIRNFIIWCIHFLDNNFNRDMWIN